MKRGKAYSYENPEMSFLNKIVLPFILIIAVILYPLSFSL